MIKIKQEINKYEIISLKFGYERDTPFYVKIQHLNILFGTNHKPSTSILVTY
jgi:hypothetical protein